VGLAVLAQENAVVTGEHYIGVLELTAVLKATDQPLYHLVNGQHRAQAVAVEFVDLTNLFGR
jgi:hypothetical protein